MSATVIPDLMPSRRTSWPGSPASSRSFSSCQIGLTMSATGRSGFGKAVAGTPGGATTSCAAPEMANAAAKTTPIVIRVMRPELLRLGSAEQLRSNSILSSNETFILQQSSGRVRDRDLVFRGLGDRSSLVFFSHDKFQETESVGCTGVPMRVDCPGWQEQAVHIHECCRLLTLLLLDACTRHDVESDRRRM